MLAKAIGYTAQMFGHRLDARWVGFYWDGNGDEANYDDGCARGTGEYTGYCRGKIKSFPFLTKREAHVHEE